MVFGFDPRKLVDEDKKEKKKEVEDVVWEQVSIDEEEEKKENQLRRTSNIKKALTQVDQIIREFKYEKKYGKDAYHDAKLKQNPYYRDPRKYTDEENKEWFRKEIESMRGMFQGATIDWKTGDTIWPEGKGPKTLEREYGEKPEEQTFKNMVKFASTNSEDGQVSEWESTGSSPDPFANEVGVTESIYGALLSGTIKIPKGFISLGAMIMDEFDDEDIPVDKGRVARLERWWDSTFFGAIEAYGESKANETAIGKITEALVQLYGGWKTVGKLGVNITEKSLRIFNRAKDAMKNGRYVRTYGNKNLYEGAKKAAELNKLSRTQQYIAIGVGGGVAGAVVYDTEDIGTFGDWFFDEAQYTALDRNKRATAKDDATRMLYNKLKFSGELGFPIIPAVVGAGRVGKAVLKSGKDWAYSNDAVERFLDKYLTKNLRARGPLDEEVFQAGQRLEGKMASSQALAGDYLRNFDQILKRISKNSQSASDASGLKQEISDLIVDVIKKGKLNVKKVKAGNRVVAEGFDSKTLNKFYKALTQDLKVSEKNALALIDELGNVHGSWAEFLNNVARGGNLNVALKEFVSIMNNRIGTTLTNQYKIFGDSSIRPINEFVPAKDIKNEVRDIFIRNAEDNGVRMSRTEAVEAVNAILKNVVLDAKTATPVFKFEAMGALKDKAMITKNIAENITGGGKFKPDKKGGLIQTEKDLKSFQKLFGNYSNAQNVIANVTTDLAQFAARDRFYNKVKLDSEALAKSGERALVYPTYNEAFKAFNAGKGGAFTRADTKIVEAPLKLPQGIGEEVYTVPLNGMFTTEAIADGLRYGVNSSLSKKAMPIWYQTAILIPKGLVQAGKTVFGPFTHARNYTSGAVTTVATGNIFINPFQIGKAFRTAYRTTQPQLLPDVIRSIKAGNIVTRNRPGLKVATDTSMPGKFRPGANTTDPNKLIPATEFTEEGGQSLYRFLLDEGMVNQSATYRDLMGLIDDTQKTGFFEAVGKKMNNKLLKHFKKFGKTMQDLYVAEDDFWKVWNFAAESHRIRRAYSNALKDGKITMKEVPGGSLESVDILKMATQNVREMLPNYAYVSPFIKGMRQAPVGNFVSWPSEIIRGSTNMTLKAIKETKDPILHRMGYERLLGMTAAWATLPPLAVWGFSQAYGFTREKLNALKEFVPWFSADSTILPVYVDGKYKYIDFSRGYFYDTIVNPVQAVITQVEKDKEGPLVPALAEGMVRASWRLVEPFVSEAIWVGGILDILVRGGKTRQGTQVYNPREPWGDKVKKAIMHQAKVISPGSRVQMERLYAAVVGKTIKGQDFEIPDELLGLVGARPAPMDIMKSMNIFINEYLRKNERLERNITFQGLRTGDPVEPNDLIEQFITANKQKYESFSELRRKIDAGGVLGYKQDIEDLFTRREETRDYNMIMDNEFRPFTITADTIRSFEYLEEDQAKKGLFFKSPLDDRMLDTLDRIIEDMENIPLNSEWTIDADDYKYKAVPSGAIDKILPKKDEVLEGGWEKVQTPPLPKTPMPVVNNAALTTAKNPETNLTRSEEALLSPSEKIIAGRT